MPKTPPRLTRKERQAKFGKGPSGTPANKESEHIHCIACGRHLDAREFEGTPRAAEWLTCLHGSRFAACQPCVTEAQTRIDEHDRTGQPPRIAPMWH